MSRETDFLTQPKLLTTVVTTTPKTAHFASIQSIDYEKTSEPEPTF